MLGICGMLIDWICRMLIVALGALVGTNEPIEKPPPVETFLMLILSPAVQCSMICPLKLPVWVPPNWK